MLSFKSLATVATLAFGALSAMAAPAPQSHGAAGLTSLAEGLKHNVRDVQVVSVAQVIQTTTVTITPVVQKLQFITPQNCTVDVLTPVVNDIKTILGTAVSEVNALVGKDVATILANVDGTAQVTVQELAKLVADLVNLVFAALGAVLAVAGGAIGDIMPLLVAVGELVGSLLHAVLALVGGLLGGLVPAILALVGGILSVVLSLRINVLITLFGIQA